MWNLIDWFWPVTSTVLMLNSLFIKQISWILFLKAQIIVYWHVIFISWHVLLAFCKILKYSIGCKKINLNMPIGPKLILLKFDYLDPILYQYLNVYNLNFFSFIWICIGSIFHTLAFGLNHVTPHLQRMGNNRFHFLEISKLYHVCYWHGLLHLCQKMWFSGTNYPYWSWFFRIWYLINVYETFGLFSFFLACYLQFYEFLG